MVLANDAAVPSAILQLRAACRQLGLTLHALESHLPLYDGLSGQLVPPELDERVEKLRDQLMDEARERVDELGEDAVAGTPLFHLSPVTGS